jgi:nicotinamide riboside kinase
MIAILGTADCGKSTIVKQLRFVILSIKKKNIRMFIYRIIHDSGFGKVEIEKYKGIIYSTILYNMLIMIEMKETLGIIGTNPDIEVCLLY